MPTLLELSDGPVVTDLHLGADVGKIPRESPQPELSPVYAPIQRRRVLGYGSAHGLVVALVRGVIEEWRGVTLRRALRLDPMHRGDVSVVGPDLHDVAGLCSRVFETSKEDERERLHLR